MCANLRNGVQIYIIDICFCETIGFVDKKCRDFTYVLPNSESNCVAQTFLFFSFFSCIIVVVNVNYVLFLYV